MDSAKHNGRRWVSLPLDHPTRAVMSSIIPALSLADQEVAERLHPGHRFEFLGVDEIGVERDGFRLAEQLHEAAVFFDDVVGQHGNAEPRSEEHTSELQSLRHLV